MFEDIPFHTYRTRCIPDSMRSSVTQEDLRRYERAAHYPENSFSLENIHNTSCHAQGLMTSFLRPPIPEETIRTLYHMENFDIFTCEGHYYTRRSNFHSFLILYTYEGCGHLDYEGKTYDLEPGDGFFIDCTLPHHYYSEGPVWKHGVLHFNGPLVPSLHRQYMKNGCAAFTVPFDGFYQRDLESLLKTYCTASPFRDYQAADLLSHILTQLLTTPWKKDREDTELSQTLRDLTVFMENHFSEDMTLDTLAKFSGISKYYLSREFKKLNGYSPIDYLIRLRVEHAQTLLRSTDLPVNTIAREVGIPDINNFNALFKKRVGSTPGEYRRRYL